MFSSASIRLAIDEALEFWLPKWEHSIGLDMAKIKIVGGTVYNYFLKNYKVPNHLKDDLKKKIFTELAKTPKERFK